MEKTTERKHCLAKVVSLIILALIAIYVIWAVFLAKPIIKPTEAITWTSASVPSKALPWPSYGQAAVGLNGSGVINTNGAQTPVPMASTAKLITALVVLQKYPLSANSNGPLITLSSGDVAIYNNYQSEDGSDMLITAGEQLSEYQMLEAMLLPSADNIADSLAIWAYGSLSAYAAVANQYLKTDGLTNIQVGVDASGFDPSTTSSASDLVKLGEIAMNNPVIAGIVAKSSVSGIPIVGTIKNVNNLLGKDSIIGIKTGNTLQAGGVFVSASTIEVDNQTLTLYTAVMQAPTLFDALSASQPLIEAAQSNFSTPTNLAGISSGSIVGQYLVPWSGKTITAVTSQAVNIDSLGGSHVNQTVTLKSIAANAKPGQVIGNIKTSSSVPKFSVTTPAIINRSPGQPSKWWLLVHPKSFINF